MVTRLSLHRTILSAKELRRMSDPRGLTSALDSYGHPLDIKGVTETCIFFGLRVKGMDAGLRA